MISINAALPKHLVQSLQVFGTREEWVESRKDYIGGSELAAALGLSTFQNATALRVWEGKVPGYEPDPLKGPWIRWGHRMEPVILDAFEEEITAVEPTWAVVVTSTEHAAEVCKLYSKDRLFRSTPDGLICDNNTGELVAGVDCKNIASFNRKKFGKPIDTEAIGGLYEEGSDDLIDDYLIQGLTYCEIWEVEHWYFAAYFGGGDFQIFRVDRDTETAQRLFASGRKWWDAHVAPAQRSPAEALKYVPEVDEAFVKRHYVVTTDEVVPFEPEGYQMAVQLRDARKAKKAAKELEDEARGWLITHCLDKAGMQGVCSAKQNKDSVKTDWKAAFDELYTQQTNVDAKAASDLVKAHTKTTKGNRTVRPIIEDDEE